MLNFKTLINRDTQNRTNEVSKDNETHRDISKFSNKSSDALTIHGVKLKRLVDGRLCLDGSQTLSEVVSLVSEFNLKRIKEAVVDTSKPGIYLINEVYADYGKMIKNIDNIEVFGETLYYEDTEITSNKSVIKEYHGLIQTNKLLGYDIMNNTDKVFGNIQPKQTQFIPIEMARSLTETVKERQTEVMNFSISNWSIVHNKIVPYRVQESENETKIKLLATLSYKDNTVGCLVGFTNIKGSMDGYLALDRKVMNSTTLKKEQVKNKIKVSQHAVTYFLTMSEILKMAKNPKFNGKVAFENFELKQAYGNDYIKISEQNDIVKFDLGTSYQEFMSSCQYMDQNKLKAFALVSNQIPALGEFLPIKYFKN